MATLTLTHFASSTHGQNMLFTLASRASKPVFISVSHHSHGFGRVGLETSVPYGLYTCATPGIAASVDGHVEIQQDIVDGARRHILSSLGVLVANLTADCDCGACTPTAATALVQVGGDRLALLTALYELFRSVAPAFGGVEVDPLEGEWSAEDGVPFVWVGSSPELSSHARAGVIRARSESVYLSRIDWKVSRQTGAWRVSVHADINLDGDHKGAGVITALARDLMGSLVPRVSPDPLISLTADVFSYEPSSKLEGRRLYGVQVWAHVSGPEATSDCIGVMFVVGVTKESKTSLPSDFVDRDFEPND